MDKIIKRILEQSGDELLLDRLAAMPNADLNSLLIKLFETRSANVTPAQLLKAYEANRFSVPSEFDPAEFRSFEAELLHLAKTIGINGVLLSPTAPLFSGSAFGCVSQNNVISAARGVELLPDPTNMLAIIIAEQLKNNKAANDPPLHYCTSTRVTRAQDFPKAKGFYAHFGIFCIVSSARDTGSYSAEGNMLVKQLEYYKLLLLNKYNATLNITISKRGGYADGNGFFEKITDIIKTSLPDVPVTLDYTKEDNQYYRGMNYKLYMEKDGELTEIGDGGFVDWISRLTGSKKERSLISGIGIDRLFMLK